jgi:hypothetical protein
VLKGKRVSPRLRAKTQGHKTLMAAWQDIPWKHVQRSVFHLQKRIYVRHESRIPAYKNATTEENSFRESLFPVPT